MLLVFEEMMFVDEFEKTGMSGFVPWTPHMQVADAASLHAA